MKKVTVGLICAPNLPAEIASKLMSELPDLLSDKVDDAVKWEVEMTVDPLVGIAEDIIEVIHKAHYIKQENRWDYTICLTDLPTFYHKYIIVANASVKKRIAQISVPTFGFMPMRRRIRKTFMQLMGELYVPHMQNSSDYAESNNIGATQERSTQNKLTRQFSFSSVGRMQRSSKHEDVDLRYFIKSRLVGNIRVLLGMTFANKPWKALLSFNKVIILSFATGSYISIFNSPWKLSVAYSPLRFITLMLVAIFGMVAWVIFSQNLWEKPSSGGKKRWRRLYNGTTFLTLSTIVIINYVLLFMLFSIAISLFVPPDLFEAWTGLDKEPSFVYYLRLVWLITSLGTLAGAIGKGLESEQKVREATYSYRQKQRYYAFNQEEKQS